MRRRSHCAQSRTPGPAPTPPGTGRPAVGTAWFGYPHGWAGQGGQKSARAGAREGASRRDVRTGTRCAGAAWRCASIAFGHLAHVVMALCSYYLYSDLVLTTKVEPASRSPSQRQRAGSRRRLPCFRACCAKNMTSADVATSHTAAATLFPPAAMRFPAAARCRTSRRQGCCPRRQRFAGRRKAACRGPKGQAAVDGHRSPLPALQSAVGGTSRRRRRQRRRYREDATATKARRPTAQARSDVVVGRCKAQGEAGTCACSANARAGARSRRALVASCIVWQRVSSQGSRFTLITCQAAAPPQRRPPGTRATQWRRRRESAAGGRATTRAKQRKQLGGERACRARRPAPARCRWPARCCPPRR